MSNDMMEVVARTKRFINRDFSLGEYDRGWTKLERYLFIEVYEVIKDFYIATSDKNIISYSSDLMRLKIPTSNLNPKFFSRKNMGRDLYDAAKRLSKKQINTVSVGEGGQVGFSFKNIFSEIVYAPENDKENIYVEITSQIYEEMVPIESYCILDLKLISDFNSGNTVRLYEIFKSYAFRKKITLSFTSLRKKLGFFEEGSYEEWKHFNAQVLKPAVKEINNKDDKNKELFRDIEVFYEKKRGSQDINFTIVTHAKELSNRFTASDLNAPIINRKPGLRQSRYIKTTIERCNDSLDYEVNKKELMTWIISDLMNQQEKHGVNFDFKHAMNAISKQLRSEKYTRPYSHRHKETKRLPGFNDKTYSEIKELVAQGLISDVLSKYSAETLKLHHFDYLLA